MNIHEDKQAKEEDVFKMLIWQVQSEQRKVEAQQVRSEAIQLYQALCESVPIDQAKCIQALNRHYITYSINTPFQPFSFHVEKTFPGQGYFLIQVKIAHFTLNVSVIRHPSPIKVDSKTSDIKSTFAKIHFVDYGDQKLCFKSFLFRSQEEFQGIFAEALKEWTLLKICSVLECGPFIGNQMGFDIVIYDDCIQYQTQKGKQFKEVTRTTIGQLKQQLKVMHSFKIIHHDIKPQNIVMSKHFKKPIFIDFGFSDIVKEDMGYKTLTVFRGTPDFCTAEMLATMMKREGYVDLYYNDAYGLDLVFKKLVEEQQATFHQEQGENDVASFEKPAEPLDHEWEIQAFFAFQYHYINSKIFKAKELMMPFVVKESQNIKKVLKFIKSISSQLFLSEVFQCLREYSYMLEYKEIQQKVRVQKAMLFQRERQDEENTASESAICQPIGNYNKNIHDGLKYQTYMRVIANFREDEADQIDSLVYILFESIRFDIKNLTLEEKVEIAIKINPIFLAFLKKNRTDFVVNETISQSMQNNPIHKVQFLMILILQFCLNQQSSKWTKENIFEVCQQLLLMDVDFTQQITRLNQYISLHFLSLTEIVLAYFEYSRLRQTSIMIFTQHTEQQSKMLSIINDKALELAQKALEYQETTNNAEYSLLKKIMKIFAECQHITKEEQEQAYMYVKDSKLKKFILLYSIQKRIEDFPTLMSQQLLQLIEYIKKSNQLKSLGLICFMRLTVKALSNLNNFQGIQSYCNYICSIINCPFISNLFIVDTSPLLVFDPQSITSKLARYARMYGLLPKHRQPIDKSFFQIFRFINRRKLANQHPMLDQINKFCQVYQRDFRLIDDYWQADAWALNGIYYKINLDFEIGNTNPQALDFFLGNYLLCKNYWQKYMKQSEIKEQDASPLTIKFMMLYYEYFMCKLYKEDDKIFPIIQQLKSISKFFNNHFLVLEFLKLQAQTIVCCQMGNSLLNACSLQIYDFCKSINNISFYLIQGNLIEAFFILKALEQTSQDLFLAIMYQIIDFLHRYQFQPYFHNFIKLIDYFLQHNPGRGVTMHYSKFQTKIGISLKNNPYLLIFYVYSLRFEQFHSQLRLFRAIAANCDHLNGLPKKKIMQKYFTVMLDCLDTRMRRKKICVFRLGKQYLSGVGIRRHGKEWFQVRKAHFVGGQIFYKIAYEKMQVVKFYLSA